MCKMKNVIVIIYICYTQYLLSVYHTFVSAKHLIYCYISIAYRENVAAIVYTISRLANFVNTINLQQFSKYNGYMYVYDKVDL